MKRIILNVTDIPDALTLAAMKEAVVRRQV